MKKLIAGLFAVAVLSGSQAMGQTQSTLPVTHGAAGASGQAGGPVLQGGAITDPSGGCCAGSADGGPATKTVCVPETYTKKTVKRCYSCGCEPLCVCFWRSLCCGACAGGGGCGDGHCEHPYTRRFLILKLRPCEECATKCVPREVPCCEAQPCPLGGCAAAPPIVPGAGAAPTSVVVGSGAGLSGPVVHSQR